MACFVVICLIAGLWQALQGYWGREVEAAPRCRNCGYDLRGVVAGEVRGKSILRAQANRCSECGSDLLRPGAIQTTTRKISRGRIVVAVLIVATPWLLILLAMIPQWTQALWTHLRSNRSLVSAVGSHPWDEGQLWLELRRRLASGRLDAAETSDAIDRLIEEIASQRKQSSILSLPQGAREFADAFVAANSPSDAQYLALAKAFYGDNPQVKISAIDPQAAQLDVALSRIDPQSILRKLCSVYSVADISLIPEGTKDTDFSQKWQHASSDSRNGYGEYSWGALGSYYSLHLAAPPGRYVARVVIDVGMVANAGVTPWGWPGPPSRWGNTKAHWVETFHTPIQVPAPIQRGADGRPTTTLVTDAALDPQKTGTITAKAAALCYPDGTEIYVTLDYSHILVPLFAKSALLIDGRRYESGLIDFILAAHQTGLMIDIGALPKSVTSCKVSLVPDVTFAHSCGYDRCWGKPIELEDVPIMHMERTGTFAGYLEWKRDAIAKAVAATKKPAQPATQK